ncbi:hypothetical protein BCN_3516 [Bacillus cereus NC7401]|nr:hypothetical protein BCN_3516 [Bacillus cereus NC7401]
MIVVCHAIYKGNINTDCFAFVFFICGVKIVEIVEMFHFPIFNLFEDCCTN